MLTLGEFFHLLNKNLPRCAEAAETLRVSLWMCQARDSGEQGEGRKVWMEWEGGGDRHMHRPFSG